MANILDKISSAISIGIAGHVRPDGDCVGSCMAMFLYLSKRWPEKKVDVYLEMVPEVFHYMKGIHNVHTDYNAPCEYDVFISLDCGDEERLGAALPLYQAAKHTINIDHHISNTNYGDENYVLPDASSTCETMYSLLDKEYIDKDIATALYTGIVHDTGVFKHSNTSKNTMVVAGELLAYDIEFSKIIDESFYQKTYMQNQLLGRCLTESILVLDGKCIISTISKEIMDFYGARPKDIDGIIDQLRVTKGVEVALLLHETGNQQYKVSMRANGDVDVSKIAVYFGGGGHVKAAGCTMTGTSHDVINNITRLIYQQLQELS
ncbi:MAG: bifunctional oligoribonuclease/PAP phosphatase NrnA [bacterium]|nr:bifunctional oligoribonuclease/PAP phosphatase NrnA [bacterium]